MKYALVCCLLNKLLYFHFHRTRNKICGVTENQSNAQRCHRQWQKTSMHDSMFNHCLKFNYEPRALNYLPIRNRKSNPFDECNFDPNNFYRKMRVRILILLFFVDLSNESPNTELFRLHPAFVIRIQIPSAVVTSIGVCIKHIVVWPLMMKYGMRACDLIRPFVHRYSLCRRGNIEAYIKYGPF